MANLNLLDPGATAATNNKNNDSNAKVTRKVCQYCQKIYHRNSLTRHQKSCPARDSSGSGAKRKRSSPAGDDDDDGGPPELCLVSDMLNESATTIKGDENSSNGLCEDTREEPPRLQSINEDRENGYSRTRRSGMDVERKAKNRSKPESCIRRLSFDQLGIPDTSSEYSESNDSFRMHLNNDSSGCAKDKYQDRNAECMRRRSVSINGKNEFEGPKAVKLASSVVCKNGVTKKVKEQQLINGVVDSYVCVNCGEEFLSQADLASHGFKYIQKGVLVCLLCSNKKVEDLDEHLRAEHQSDKKKVQCPVCGKAVDKNYNFLHLKEHHAPIKKFSCDQCGLKFNFLQNLLYHKGTDHLKETQHSKYCQRNGDMMKVVSSNRFNEDRPAVTISRYRVRELGSRDKFSSKNGSQNNYAGVHFAGKEHLQVVNESEHETETKIKFESEQVVVCSREGISGSRRSSCSTDGSYSSSDNSLASPRSSSESSVTSSSVKRKDNTQSSTLVGDVLKNYSCQVCQDTMKTRLNYLYHLRDEHHWPREKRLDAEYEPAIWCPECGLEFMARPTLQKHLVVAHDDIVSPEMYMEAVGYGRRPLLSHQCSVCFNVFDSDITLTSHLRCHGLAYLEYLSRNNSKY